MTRIASIGVSRDRGFTLVEMMIVLVIISIMTVLMIPEMKGSYEEALLRSNARKMGAAFKAAYSRSITTQKQHRVRIDPEESKLFVEERSAESETPYMPIKQFDRKISQLHPNVSIHFHEAKPGFTGQEDGVGAEAMDSNPKEIPDGVFLFYPNGTSEGKDIELRDRMGFGLMVRLNPITSRVRFENLERIQP
ncbi:prepilin-type N-terminal cleavage/methylation domain-containing protein [bacterium]|nr:prepilin-type N-terminal cleavage/methylation domain-containing protein [bacterium]